MDDVLSPLTPGHTKIEPTIDALDRRAAHAHKRWIGDGVNALNVPEVSLSDYSPTSVGNIKRVDQAVDWLQERGARLDDKFSPRARRRQEAGEPPRRSNVDAVQSGFWETYRWVQRLGMRAVDELLLNGIENGVDSTVNSLRTTPAETIVD